MSRSTIPGWKGTREVNAPGLLFEVEDVVGASAPPGADSGGDRLTEDLTPVAGVALWAPLLDRLNVVAEADRRNLRPIGPTGYSGGECYRALIEVLLAGGDFLSDRSLGPREAAGAGCAADRAPPTQEGR